MNSLTLRALMALPQPLQQKVRAHRFDERDDLIGQVALELLEAGLDVAAVTNSTARLGQLGQVFNKARAAVRRFSQDPAHYSSRYGYGLEEEIDPDEVTAARTRRRGVERREIVLETARRAGITERAAQLRVKKTLARATANGDLFSGCENGGEEEE